MEHDQDCCETVEIYDITGNLQSLIGAPLLLHVKKSVKSGQQMLLKNMLKVSLGPHIS